MLGVGQAKLDDARFTDGSEDSMMIYHQHTKDRRRARAYIPYNNLIVIGLLVEREHSPDDQLSNGRQRYQAILLVLARHALSGNSG